MHNFNSLAGHHYKKFCCHSITLTVLRRIIVFQWLPLKSNWQHSCHQFAYQFFFLCEKRNRDKCMIDMVVCCNDSYGKNSANQSNHTNCCNDTEAVYTIRKFCCHLFKLTVFAGRIIVKRLLQLSNWQIICQNHATKKFFWWKWKDICYVNRIAVGMTAHICVCTVCSITMTVLEIKIDNITVMMKKTTREVKWN